MRLITRRLTLTLLAAAGSLLLLGCNLATSSASLSGAGLSGCVAAPHTCGFPDATNAGVPAGMTLKAVPGQVSSGPGWHYDSADHQADVTGSGAVLSGLFLRCNLNITASNVTIKDVRVVTGGYYGISLEHTTGVTIENSTVSGLNTTAGRVNNAISDAYGDSTGMVIADNNISAFRSAIQVSTGLVTGNYIHDPGYIVGDHTNGVIANGGSEPLTIYHNTILNSLGQTDAITIDTMQVPGPVTNKVIEDNLLAGGGYPIYGGAAFGHATAHILIENNVFGQDFYRMSGQFGPVAYFDPAATGNIWSGNIWTSTGKTIPAPQPPSATDAGE
jgi:Right handed beta helix region